MDTHDRIATCAVKDRISKGIQSELAPHTLTISSIDNIDIMQRHAMVSTAQSKRSWHGTSVQCVQPMPKSIVLTEEEIHGATYQQAGESVETSAKESTVVLSKHSSSSPTMSPALKQVEKRRRTLREQSLTHTTTQLAGGRQISPEMFASMYESTAYQRPSISRFSIRSFQIFPEEESNLDQLRDSIFQYIVLKEAHSEELNLTGLPSFLSAMRYTGGSNEQSTVVYVDIVSLPADSKDTVLHVLNKLHHTFIVKMSFRWLIVVGDAKTYDILQELRRQYGSQMQWMLPLPGDWHILYSYQKVLLKIYGEAGLLQLAKVAGHRAETLTALAQASHFKRTHHFILQSFEAIHRHFLRLYVNSLETSTVERSHKHHFN